MAQREGFEDTKGVIRITQSTKDRQYYKDQDHLRPSYVCQIVQDGCMDQVFHDVG